MHYCRDHFWNPVSESRHLRGSIRRPVLKKHGFQCSPGIDGGVEQTNIGFLFFYVVSIKLIMYDSRDHFWGPSSESRHLRGSIRRLVPEKHRFQCSPGIDGGVKQNNIGFQFFFVRFFV